MAARQSLGSDHLKLHWASDLPEVLSSWRLSLLWVGAAERFWMLLCASLVCTHPPLPSLIYAVKTSTYTSSVEAGRLKASFWSPLVSCGRWQIIAWFQKVAPRSVRAGLRQVYPRGKRRDRRKPNCFSLLETLVFHGRLWVTYLFMLGIRFPWCDIHWYNGHSTTSSGKKFMLQSA